MHIRLAVFIKAEPQNRQKLLDLLFELEKKSQQEKGCIGYYLYVHPTDQNQLYIHEEWESAEALANHEKTEHFVRICPQLGQLAKLDLKKQQVVDM